MASRASGELVVDRRLIVADPEINPPEYDVAYFDAARIRGIGFVENLIGRNLTPFQVNEVLASMSASLKDGPEGARSGSAMQKAFSANPRELNAAGRFVTEIIAAGQTHLAQRYRVGIVPGNDERDSSQRPVRRVARHRHH